MGVGSGLYSLHVRCSRKTFTFAISSSDELLYYIIPKYFAHHYRCQMNTEVGADVSDIRSQISNHRLRSSASPVWRLALSMGKGNFRPPTESTPLNRSPKNCHR